MARCAASSHCPHCNQCTVRHQLGPHTWFCSGTLLGRTVSPTDSYRVNSQATNNLVQGLLLMKQSPLTKTEREEARNNKKRALKIKVCALGFSRKGIALVPFHLQHLFCAAAWAMLLLGPRPSKTSKQELLRCCLTFRPSVPQPDRPFSLLILFQS